MNNALFDEIYGTPAGANKILVPHSRASNDPQSKLLNDSIRPAFLRVILFLFVVFCLIFAFYLFQNNTAIITEPDLPKEITVINSTETSRDLIKDAVGFLMYKEKAEQQSLNKTIVIEPKPEPIIKPKPKTNSVVNHQVPAISQPEELAPLAEQKPVDPWGQKVAISQRQTISEKQVQTSTQWTTKQPAIADETRTTFNSNIQTTQAISEKSKQPTGLNTYNDASKADEKIETRYYKDEVTATNKVSEQVLSNKRFRLSDISCNGINNAAIKTKVLNYTQHQARTIRCSGFSFQVNADVISVTKVESSHANKSSCEILQEIDKHCL